MPLETGTKPFVFKTELSLVALSGFKAADLRELYDCLKQVPVSSIYQHTHNFICQHQFLVQEPPNDFAYWVTYRLNESKAGESLTSVDAIRFSSLEELRSALVGAIEPFLNESHVLRKVPAGQEFYFMKAILFVLQTPYTAATLEEFLDGLKRIGPQSLYYHLFEARLRGDQRSNDFSLWLESRGEERIAREINCLDPYSRTMEDIRKSIVQRVEKRLQERAYAKLE